MSTQQEHIVLIGDSILDNKNYVPRQSLSVIKQLKAKISPFKWKGTNCAVDGAITSHVLRDQITTIPNDATTIVLSSGGNDGLDKLHDLSMDRNSWWPWNLLRILYNTRKEFQIVYAETLKAIKTGFPKAKVICCTIYYPQFQDYHIFIQIISNIGINLMSNVIINTCLQYGNIPIIDLRHVFDKKEDYANSIEPGVPGGDKITNNIIHIVKNHDFNKEYNKEKYVIYKINNYSDGLDPSHYGSMHWRPDDNEEQAGNIATKFFRRAFNERKNTYIKAYCKIIIVVMVVCIVWIFGF
eukprot:238462_1